jgi:CRP-like cAMP-binding protein
VEFPNYAAGTWGPKAAFELIERDGRKWMEVLNRETLEKVPLFEGADAVLLAQVIMALKPVVFQPGEVIMQKGEIGSELYLIARGEVEVIDAHGHVAATLGEGNFFGEVSLLTSAPRMATVRAKLYCDFFVLSKADFARILRERPQFMQSVIEIARARYNVAVENMLSEL